MIHVHVSLQPHAGAPIVRRAEAAAASLQRAAKRKDAAEPHCALGQAALDNLQPRC